MNFVLPVALLVLSAATETAPSCADRSGQCPEGALEDDVTLMQMDLVQMVSRARRSEERSQLRANASSSSSTLVCTGTVVPEVQIGIAMDCTGSTSKYLGALKSTVVSLAGDLKKKAKNLQMAFLCYRDHLDVNPPRFEWAARASNGDKWFTDIAELQSTMAPFFSTGGNDLPEDNAGGMGQFLNTIEWSPTATKLLMVISKDKDSKRTPYKTAAQQCQLMKDLKAAGLNLILGHMDNNPYTSMLADSPGWRKCYNDEKMTIEEVDITGHVDTGEFEDTLLYIICETLEPNENVTVTGDPHVTNLDGDRFNLIRTGTHQLLRLPQQTGEEEDEEEPMLQVLGKVESEQACLEAYVRELDIAGRWLSEAGGLRFAAAGTSPDDADAVVLEVNGTRYDAESLRLDARFAKLLEVSVPPVHHSKRPDGKIRRSALLKVRVRLPLATLTVDWVHRKVPGGSSINHLNFVATGLPRHGMDIGGILGRDDHTEASTRGEECQLPQSALVVPAVRSRDRQQESQVLSASFEDLQQE